MNNIHIISLPRSGSKSLEAAVSQGEILKYESGAPLGEYFNGYGAHRFKFFGDQPFIKRDLSDAVPFNDPRFFDTSLKSFIPKYDIEKDVFEWAPTHYRTLHSLPYLMDLGSQLYRACAYTRKRIVLKTQYAEILNLWEGNEVDAIEFITSVFRGESVIFLYRKDLISWVCSNFFAKGTGIYANGPSMQLIVQDQEKAKISEDFMLQQLSLLKRHFRLYKSIQYTAIRVDELDCEVESWLSDLLAMDVRIPEVKEFSNIDYSSRISNYSWLERVVRDYFQPVVEGAVR